MGELIDLERERIQRDPERRDLVAEGFGRALRRAMTDPHFCESMDTYPARFTAAMSRVVEQFERGEMDAATAREALKETARRFGVIPVWAP